MKHSHSAEKLEREDHLGFLKLQFGAKYFYKMKGEPFGDKKMSEKSRRDEKNSEDRIVSSGIVSNVKKGVNERGDHLH